MRHHVPVSRLRLRFAASLPVSLSAGRLENLALCHVAITSVGRSADEALVRWARSVAVSARREDLQLYELPAHWLVVTDAVLLQHPELSTVAPVSLPDNPSTTLSASRVLQLRFLFLCFLNSLVKPCMPQIDLSQAHQPWTMAFLVKKFGHLVFKEPKVGRSLFRAPSRLWYGCARRGVVWCRVLLCCRPRSLLVRWRRPASRRA